MEPSALGQTVTLLPGAGAGEGVAGGPAWRAMAAAHGVPSLYMASSVGRQVGQGADPCSIGVEKLHSDLCTTTTSQEDH